jgi:hypothetical protein
MTVVELQFRERAFLDLIGSEAVRPPLAPRILDEVRRRNGDEQATRLRVTGVEWAAPFLRARAPEPGAVLVKITMAVELTGLPVRWDGALVTPVAHTRSLAAELWVEVSVARTGLCYRLTELFVLAPVVPLPPDAVPLLLDGDQSVTDHGAIVVGDGVVSVRLATAPDDDVTGPVDDRLHGLDCGRFVPGALLAASVVDGLDDALDAATASFDAEVRVDERPTGRWRDRAPATVVVVAPAGEPAPDPAHRRRGEPVTGLSGGRRRISPVPDATVDAAASEPVASASARLVAVGALPFAFDLPFTLSAEARFSIMASGAAPVLACTTLVRVQAADPDALEAFGVLEVLRDDLRAGLDARLDTTPSGAAVVDEGSAALRVQARRALSVPASRAWSGVVVAAEVDAGGLSVRGTLAPRSGQADLRSRRGVEWDRLRPAFSRSAGVASDRTLAIS